MTWFKSVGKLVYDPVRPGLKRRNGPGWAVVEIGNGITWYYRWLLRSWGIDVDVPAWQAHITVCDGSNIDPKKYAEFWKKYDGLTIEFEYSIDVYRFARFYALRVQSKQLDAIRAELGLKPNYPFHITIGSTSGWQEERKLNRK